mgnify:FL=1
MLSILIPTYNYNITTLVKVLSKQALVSGVLYEIIVLEDGTLDTQITQQNQSIVSINQCFYHKNQTNIGRTATRNKLSEIANFDWLLFLDADLIPLNHDFIQTYVKELNNKYDVVSGGIVYEAQRPTHKQLLRWVYGRARESKSAEARNKKPYNIISANLLITKEVFLKANNFETNHYGLDILFSYKLKIQKATVLHIENQVIHLGLENTASFIKKSLQSLETTFLLETNKKMDFSSRPLQIKYYQLKKIGALPILNTLLKRFEKPILKNLHSKNPSLLLFDLYRLNYYSKLKANA